MHTNKISFYFQKLTTNVSSDDDIPALIQLHSQSFARHGWEVVHANEEISKQHRLYEYFNDPNTILSKSRNPWEYTRACYMRWLAYATLGYPFADYDVMNYGFTPKDAEQVKSENRDGSPIFLSGAGAMGLIEGADYDKVLETYIDFINAPKIEGPIAEDINDMTIMRHYHPEWYNCVPYEDNRFVKDFGHHKWDEANLVHYPYGLTQTPRAQTIISVRPPAI